MNVITCPFPSNNIGMYPTRKTQDYINVEESTCVFGANEMLLYTVMSLLEAPSLIEAHPQVSLYIATE